MTKKSDVAIVVPVYNSASYLSRCVDSLINQSYKNTKIFLIDDNSSDNSLELIKDYCSKYDNITYHHNSEQLGVSKTRNIGIELVDAEYVIFLDSDDWLDLNCIYKAVKLMQANPMVDVALWEIKTAYGHNKVDFRYKYGTENIITGTMALKLLAHNSENEYFLSPLLGCKLFKKNFIDNHEIKFPDTIYEDDFFCFMSFLFAEKVGVITDSVLYYYQHSTSLTHHFTQRNVNDFFKTFTDLYNIVRTINNKEGTSSFYCYLQKSLNSMINQLLVCVQNEHEQMHFKSLICQSFFTYININEYYEFCGELSI